MNFCQFLLIAVGLSNSALSFSVRSVRVVAVHMFMFVTSGGSTLMVYGLRNGPSPCPDTHLF